MIPWLLDESFSPREFAAEEQFYSDEELQSILTDALGRADVYAADSFTVISSSIQGDYGAAYGLIDTERQHDEYYARLAKEIKTTDDVKQCFTDAFVDNVAQRYIDNLFGDDYPSVYIDRADGLAIHTNVACMPFMMDEWQSDDYTVWQNSAQQIIVIMCVDGYGFGPTGGYYALRLHLVDGRWLLDDSFTASMGAKYNWCTQ